MARELILYCDESDISGKHFANFYGGLLVESSHLAEVEVRIRRRCQELHLRDEVKWQKISTAYADKYRALIDELFDLVAEGKVKIRIMFTQNYFSPTRLTPEQREMGFFFCTTSSSNMVSGCNTPAWGEKARICVFSSINCRTLQRSARSSRGSWLP